MNIDLNFKGMTGECVKLGKALLGDLQKGRISMAAFEYECALMAVHHGFEELVHKHNPTAPMILVRYWNDPDKKSFTPEFWKREDIAKYLEDAEKVKAHNCAIDSWLRKMARIFKANGDLKNLATVKERLYGKTERYVSSEPDSKIFAGGQ